MNRTTMTFAPLLPIVICGFIGCSSATTEMTSSSPSLDSQSDETSAIIDVLRKDDEIATSVSPETDWKTDDYVLYIVAKMKRIDTDNCSEQFAAAYKEHLSAWQSHLRTVIETSSEVPTLEEYSPLWTLHGTHASNDVEASYFADFDAIETTFDECLRIAKTYDVEKSDFQELD